MISYNNGVVTGTKLTRLTRLSKTQQGEDPRNMRHGVGVLSADPDCFHFCPVATFLKYCSMRPGVADDPDAPMFLNMARTTSKDPRKACLTDGPWYINSSSGVNKIAGAVKKMVVKSEIDVGDRKISNISIRKMVASSLLWNNVPLKRIMAYTGHKSATSLINYDTMDHVVGTKISNLLFQTNSTYERQSAPPVLVGSPQSPPQASRRVRGSSDNSNDDFTPKSRKRLSIDTPKTISPKKRRIISRLTSSQSDTDSSPSSSHSFNRSSA